MCGRYASSAHPDDLVEEFEVVESKVVQPLAASWNVAPTDPVYAVMERHDTRQLRALTWGLIPSWAKDPRIGSRMINARMETVAEKPAFKRAFAQRRCLLPADGYYEWYVTDQLTKAGKPVKQPFFIRPQDGSRLAMAGLYEIWRDPAVRDEDDPGAFRWTSTIITTDAEDALGRIHDRMPLMVPRERWGEWLAQDTVSALDLLVPAMPGQLEAYPVSKAVGNVANNDATLVEPVEFA